MRQVWMAALAMSLVGCGVADDKLLSEFEEGDVESICDELEGDRSVTCSGDGFEITLDISTSASDCVSSFDAALYENCDATAGDMRACQDAWDGYTDEELCDLEALYPSECEPLYSCLVSD